VDDRSSRRGVPDAKLCTCMTAEFDGEGAIRAASGFTNPEPCVAGFVVSRTLLPFFDERRKQ